MKIIAFRNQRAAVFTTSGKHFDTIAFTSLLKSFSSNSITKTAHKEEIKNDTSNKSRRQFAVSRHFIRENSAQSAKTNVRFYEAFEMRHQQRVCEHNDDAAVTLCF